MKSIAKDLRINEQIRTREVRVISDTGEQLGVVPTYEALRIARERNLDLVEVAPTAVPPVCRLLDYGKFKYEQTKKDREARKHQKLALLKEVRLRPKIGEHDIEFKTRDVLRFLDEGDKVKVSVVFRGRELAHPELGQGLLRKVFAGLQGKAAIEKAISMEGRNMTMIVTPMDKGVKEAGTSKESKEAREPREHRESSVAAEPRERKEASAEAKNA